MRFKSVTTYTVAPDAYLKDFLSEIPTNAFFNKGRCGIGGTNREIENTKRSTIFSVPNRGILRSKKDAYPELFVIDGDVSWQEVKAQLALKKPAQKIMTTPEGIVKIIKAAKKLNMLDELYREWFLLLDESHTFISEYYRKDILKPFDYFWLFDNKTIMSATPYFFTDERFYTDLDYHEVKFTDALGTVNLIDSLSVWATLDQLIKDRESEDDQLHIAVNSVSEIPKIILRAGITDCSIYCADDKEKENMRKLGDLQRFYVEQPNESNFKKVNFYTCKYFEGWDMYDPSATMVLVTDIHNAHTMVPIAMKLKQAAGRWRNEPKRAKPLEIIHITNHRNIRLEPKSHESFKMEYFEEAEFFLENHERYLAKCRCTNRKPDPDPRLAKYADIEYKTHKAKINNRRVEQQINQAYSHEMYNNIDLIKKEWESAYFDVVVSRSTIRLQTQTTMKRKSKATQLKEDYQLLIAENSKPEISYGFGKSIQDRIRVSNPLAYQAAQLIDETVMEQLKYNVKEVKAQVIVASNTRKEVRLLQLLDNEFKSGTRYASTHIISRLQEIYTILDVKDPKTGEILKAYATHLANRGWFDVEKCKLEDDNGKYTIHGYCILRAQFNMRLASSAG